MIELMKLFVNKHDMYIELKSYKFKLLRKLVIQYDIEIWFGGRSCF